jgi:hypothetical protein
MGFCLREGGKCSIIQGVTGVFSTEFHVYIFRNVIGQRSACDQILVYFYFAESTKDVMNVLEEEKAAPASPSAVPF